MWFYAYILKAKFSLPQYSYRNTRNKLGRHKDIAFLHHLCTRGRTNCRIKIINVNSDLNTETRSPFF